MTQAAVIEPSPETLRNPLLRYLLATRPPFLLASVVSCLLGLAGAYAGGVGIGLGLALLTVLAAVLVHAGVNVLNDYYDAVNGTDEINTERLYPFTGGSRFIQNRVMGRRQMAAYGAALLLAGGVVGAGLALVSGPGLWVIGIVGVLLGWGYSAPPLYLNARGWGELCVAAGFGLLIPLGADYVQRGAFSMSPVWAGLPYGLLIANLLYINQFPDCTADAACGKRHWVVRLGRRRASWGYGLIAAAAYAVLGVEIVAGLLPATAVLAAIPLLFSAAAAVRVVRDAQAPQRLRPAIVLTLAAALGHGVILAGVLVVA